MGPGGDVDGRAFAQCIVQPGQQCAGLFAHDATHVGAPAAAGAHHRQRKPVDVVALQVTPSGGNGVARGEFGPDVRGQTLMQLCQLVGIAGFVELAHTVKDAHGDDVAHQVVEH